MRFESSPKPKGENRRELLYGLASVMVVLLTCRFMRSFIGLVAGGSGMTYDSSSALVLIVSVLGFGAFVVVALLIARSVNSSVVAWWMMLVMLLVYALVPLRSDEVLGTATLVNVLGAVVFQAFFFCFGRRTDFGLDFSIVPVFAGRRIEVLLSDLGFCL